MATPTNAISKRTRERINLLPGLLEQGKVFGERLQELYDVVIAGDAKQNTPSLVERLRNVEDAIAESKKFRQFMTYSMWGLIINAVFERLFP